MTTLAEDLIRGADAAAEYLGLDRRTVYRMTEGNELPHVRKGRLLFYRKSELDKAFDMPPAKAGPKRHPRIRHLEPQTAVIGFAQLTSLVVKHFGYGHDEFIPVAARLRHLLKNGVARAPHAGRGNHAEYGYEDVRDIMICMAMEELGISPVKAVKRVRETMTVRNGEWLEYNIRSSKLIVNIESIERSIATVLPLAIRFEMSGNGDERPEGVPEGGKWVTL